MKTTASLLALSLLLALPATLRAEAKPGEAAPAFTLTDTQGKEHSLADFKGKYVVLEWVNRDCPFVVKHYESKNMQKTQEAVGGEDTVWLSIISSASGKQGHQTPEQANAWKKEQGSEATAILLDESGKVGKDYGAKTTPHMFVINPEGNVVYAGAIDSNPSADKADIEKAENYVKSAVTAAKAGKPVEPASTKPYGCSVKYDE